VSERPFEIAQLVDVEAFAPPERARHLRVRAHLGIRAFGINAYEANEPGQPVINDHDEASSGHEELYFVARGAATFRVAEGEIEAPRGTFVFVGDPATKRSAVATQPGTTVIAVGGKAGEPFRVSGWERAQPGVERLLAGDHEGALELLMHADAEHPDQANVLYNLACAESLAGRHDDALRHLSRAIELEPSFLDYAQTDPDFDAVRQRPEFPRP
jgi:tetratricopeptide (TPR) repeat protein